MVDLTPDFVDDAVDAVVDTGDYVLDRAGDLVNLHVKSVEGLWDLTTDALDEIMGAVQECMRWLWEQVPEFIRLPFGDAAPLERAAAAWRDVIDDIERTRDDILTAGQTLSDWKGPAADRFGSYMNGLLNDAGALRAGVDGMAEALTQAAEALKDLNRLVHSVLAEIAAYIVVDVILTVLTGGGGAAAAAAQVAMLVGRVTSAIRRAVAIVRRVLPLLREAQALKAIERFTTRVDDVFDAFKTGRVVTKVDEAIDGVSKPVGRGTPWETTGADLVRKWASTAVGNGVGVSVAAGKDPSRWGTREVLGFGLGTVVSVRLGTALKPLWQRTTKGSDSVTAAAANSALSGGLTDSGVQVVTTGEVDLGRAARAAGTSGATAGAARSGTFAVRGQRWGGQPVYDRADIIPQRFEKPSHVKLTESEKGAGRMAEGLAKGGIRQVTDPTGPAVVSAPVGPCPRRLTRPGS